MLGRLPATTDRPQPPAIPRLLLDARRAVAADSLAADPIAIGRRGRSSKAAVGARLLDRATLGWSLYDQEQVESMGSTAWLERQLDPASIDDFGLDQTLDEALPSLRLSPAERLFNYQDQEAFLYFELLLATLYRAVYSPRQLFERMVIFWSDHFHISIESDFAIYLKATDDLDVIRQHALGKFPDLLRASVRSPAMLSYLTNDSNVVGHPNENYARELMELHTLGADGGYTEADVKEVARCFTGWGFHDVTAGLAFGRFAVFPDRHDSQAKQVLDISIPARPPSFGAVEADVEAVVERLLAHPSTARHVSTKMLRYLWGETPRPADIDAVAAVYTATDGDIAAMVRECLRPERLIEAPPKLKRPFHLVTSTLRALFAEIQDPFPTFGLLIEAGHLPFQWGPPNGYPDTAAYWSGLLLPRWNWASQLSTEPTSGIALPPELDGAVTQSAGWVDLFDQVLTGGRMSWNARRTLHRFVSWAERRHGALGLRHALGLALAAPEFQRY
ncbi:MAG: DUF1800 domain-containing protein [Acidobacteriota bacterium]